MRSLNSSLPASRLSLWLSGLNWEKNEACISSLISPCTLRSLGEAGVRVVSSTRGSSLSTPFRPPFFSLLFMTLLFFLLRCLETFLSLLTSFRFSFFLPTPSILVSVLSHSYTHRKYIHKHLLLCTQPRSPLT